MQAGDPPPGLRDDAQPAGKGLAGCLWAAALQALLWRLQEGTGSCQEARLSISHTHPKDQNRGGTRDPEMAWAREKSRACVKAHSQHTGREKPPQGRGQWAEITW